jgi:hypothetical protein
MSAYDEAVTTLYQAALGDFVAERKRLAAELKAAGDTQAAARIAKLVRPPVSAWAVNQLWWREREAFDALVAAAARVKVGDREASLAHRQALARLKEAAAHLLQEAGNAATESTLRRVTTTLSAVAATGGFEPDAAGALSADRDPPGFEALGFGIEPSPPPTAPKAAPGDDSAHDAEARRALEAEQRRAEETERRRREEAERQSRLAERERLSAMLRDAEQVRDSQQRDVQKLRAELEAAEQNLMKSQALLAQIEAELASL